MTNKKDPGYWFGTIIGYALIAIVTVGIISFTILVVLLVWHFIGQLLL